MKYSEFEEKLITKFPSIQNEYSKNGYGQLINYNISIITDLFPNILLYPHIDRYIDIVFYYSWKSALTDEQLEKGLVFLKNCLFTIFKNTLPEGMGALIHLCKKKDHQNETT